MSLSLSLSFSLSHPAMARSNKRDSHSKFVISQTRRASLRVRHEFAQSFLFLSFCLYLFFFLSPLAFRDEPRKLFLFP